MTEGCISYNGYVKQFLTAINYKAKKWLKFKIGGVILLIKLWELWVSIYIGSTEELLKILVDELPVKQAAGLAAKITGRKKNELYKQAMVLKGK